MVRLASKVRWALLDLQAFLVSIFSKRVHASHSHCVYVHCLLYLPVLTVVLFDCHLGVFPSVHFTRIVHKVTTGYL